MTVKQATPGPWEAKYLPQHRMRVVAGSDISICDIALWTTDYDEQMANARLIAQAPALLAALQAASGYLLNAKIDLETGAPKQTAIQTIEGGLKVVRDAITKAEGE